MIRVLLVAVLALAACKKKDASNESPTGGSAVPSGTSESSGSSAPTGDSAPTGSAAQPTSDTESSKSRQTGPGFTVSASNAATTEKVPARDGGRAFDRYTFHKTDLESYVVEVTELPAGADLGMKINEMRMRIVALTQSVGGEEMIEGEVTGLDIWYVIDQDDDTLRARSKLLAKGNKIYEIRGVSPEDKDREAQAEKFVDSFAFAP